MRLPTVFALLGLSLSCTVSARESPSGLLLQADLGRAERGAGLRPGVGVGYRFASGWAVSASTQRLLQTTVVTSFYTAPDLEPTILAIAHPEMRSYALFVSKDWALTDGGDWAVRGSLGAHHWSLDARVDEPGFLGLDFHLSGTDPAAKIELLEQITPRLSAGLGFERYWYGSGKLDRVAVSLRYQFGHAD